MQRIIPNIWFDRNAAEAADFYTAVFPDARVLDTQYYPTEGLPDFQAGLAGEVLTVDFELAGYRLTAINAGAEFTVNPSVSFMVLFDSSRDPQARSHLDELWAALVEGGRALMPLQAYDFSPHFGWIEDKYSVSWQLMLADGSAGPRPFIVPSIMFGSSVQGRAKEAIDYYTGVFGGTIETATFYPAEAGAVAGEVNFAEFRILDQWFAAMDSADQQFTFNCGVSLLVKCADQGEIDRYWDRLSAVPEAEACGWCADRFGLSWQLVPANMAELMTRLGAYQRMLAMKKLVIADL